MSNFEWARNLPTASAEAVMQPTLYSTFMDEVKYQPPHQEHFWLSTICLPIEVVPSIEAALSTLSEEYFSISLPSKATEFHAKDIFHGKGSFRRWEIDQRISLFADLLQVLPHKEIARIEIKLNPARMYHTNEHPKWAFCFMVEKVEALMRSKGGHTMLFHDKDRDADAKMAELLSTYKHNQQGTPTTHGMHITRIIETAIAVESSRSRLVQLADIYAYMMMLKEKRDPNYTARKILGHARKSDLLWPTKYRHWPS